MADVSAYYPYRSVRRCALADIYSALPMPASLNRLVDVYTAALFPSSTGVAASAEESHIDPEAQASKVRATRLDRAEVLHSARYHSRRNAVVDFTEGVGTLTASLSLSALSPLADRVWDLSPVRLSAQPSCRRSRSTVLGLEVM